MDFFDKTTSLYILKNIPLDTSYNHTWYFSNKSAQWEHFSKPEYRVATLPQSEYQRYDSGSVNVKLPMSTLYTANYMVFVNDNYIDGYGENKKFFYAFITDVEYVNPNTSRIYYEIDYMQSFLEGENNDYKLGQSFVVREHSRTDKIGDNLVNEGFNDLEHIESNDFYPDIDFSICIQMSEEVTNPVGLTLLCRLPNKNCGVADGTYYIFREFTGEVNDTLKEIKDWGGKVIQVYLAPSFSLPTSLYMRGEAYEKKEWVTPRKEITITGYPSWENNWIPKNNKLYTAPYIYIEGTDFSGHKAKYYYEYFFDKNNISFFIEGVFNNGGAMRLTPNNYKGEIHNFDESLVINNLPTMSITKDSFAVYMQNQGLSTALSTLTSLIPAVATGTLPLATGKQITSFITNGIQASARPDTAITSSFNIKMANELTKTFALKTKILPLWKAKIIDDYFTMYGYATNDVKKPNRNVRTRFTYTQTEGCVFEKVNLPQKYANKIASIYDKGITFWNPTATIGDYTTDNLPL